MEKTKLFLEAHNLKNLNAGFGQFNLNLLQAFSQIESNFEFVVHAKKKPELKHLFDFFKFKTYHYFRRYKRLRIRTNYDIWHSLNQNTKIEPHSSLPYVLTIHDINFADRLPVTNLQETKAYKRLQAKIDRSDAVIYISEFTKEATHKHFKIPNIPEYIIYNGNTIEALEKHELNPPSSIPSKPFLFTIGQTFPHKNFESLAGFLAKIPDVELVIAGNKTTPHFQIIQQAFKKHNTLDRVHFTGKISENDKHWYYANCKAFVFPSLYEGFGFPPIEAMTYGKPVFISNATSLPEIGGDAAFYWDNYNPEHMAQVFEKGMLQSKGKGFSDQMKAQAAKFNWLETAKSYIEVYNALINN